MPRAASVMLVVVLLTYGSCIRYCDVDSENVVLRPQCCGIPPSTLRPKLTDTVTRSTTDGAPASGGGGIVVIRCKSLLIVVTYAVALALARSFPRIILALHSGVCDSRRALVHGSYIHPTAAQEIVPFAELFADKMLENGR
jgi:hypothetical protein